MATEIEHIARAVSALGAPELGPLLDDFLRDISAFDMTCIFAFHPTSPPLLIHDGYSASVSRNALSSYMKGGYLLDPFYVACTSDVQDGLWRMSEIAPDEFFSSDFAASHEVHPCISDESGSLIEEIGYIVSLSGGWRATYSLMRNRTSELFSESDFTTLGRLTPLLGSLLQRHTELAALISTGPRAGDVNSVLQQAFSGQLTAAQFRIVNLVLRGHSNQSIAKELHITEGTAKLHRHNAYQRLGVTSQSDLFRMFMDFLQD